MTLKLFIIGYLTIGMLFETAMIAKDLILRYVFKIRTFTVEKTGLKTQIFIRIVGALTYPFDLALLIMMILSAITKNYSLTNKIGNWLYRNLESIDKENKGD